MKYDVAIIGAGAAGLAAARDLSGSGSTICILEARQRTGGRIHSIHLPDLPLPIELGAEFIHGEAQETFGIVEASALVACELPDNHWWVSKDGDWSQIRDFWGEIAKVQSQIGRLRNDVSFADFLRTRRSLAPRVRELARGFVEGYHAAHADRISAKALGSSDSEQERPKQFRILGGYHALIEWLRAGIDPEKSDLLLDTPVTRVEWRRGDVAIETPRGTIRAAAAIVTLPIGVWKAPREQQGAVAFDPPLTAKQAAIEKLEAGHVVKIMFRFAERFWDERGLPDSGTPLNFVHSSDRFIPTWWTSAPVRSPILTAWAGGHAADALLAEGPDAQIDRALDSMAKAFGVRRRRLDDLLRATWTHDWQSDPFTRGAYSYAGVGGTGAHRSLARPIANTLFFAGEATSSDQTGTVAGAIESGRRAATAVRASKARREG